MDHHVPFVLLTGAGAGAGDGDGDGDGNGAGSGPAAALATALARKSTASAPWLPGGQRLRVARGALDLPPKTNPSYLSPRNPDSPLYPAAIFSHLWVEKYTRQVPTTVVLVCALDSKVEAAVDALRQELRAARSHLLVVLEGSPDDPRLPALRKATGLAPRTGLIAVDSACDLDAQADSLWQLLCAQAADFFAARSRETRHKRTSADPDSDIWEARYTLKLALFSEFKADYEGAIRLYQSAYECLQVVREGAAPAAAALPWLEVCAHKIYLFLLYYQRYGSAWAKFQFHLQLSADPVWQQAQYQLFAATLQHTALERWAICEGVPRPGFLFLRAAKLAPAAAPACFEAAIADFAQMPHSRAAACADYAAWLESRGENPCRYYEQALCALPKNSRLHGLLAAKLAAADKSSALAALYVPAAVPAAAPDAAPDAAPAANIGALETPLFTIKGVFTALEAFIGKPLGFQLRITPRFGGRLTLDTLKVQFSCASVELENLEFGGAKQRTFDLTLLPGEVGECEFVDVQIHNRALGLDQRLLVEPTQEVVTPAGVRHRWVTPVRAVEVLSRPQLLELDTTRIPALLYTNENTTIALGVRNGEDEEATVQLLLREGAEAAKPLFSTTLTLGSHESREFQLPLKAPAAAFTLALCTEYTTASNASPVASQSAVHIEVVKPLRLNFALEPELHREQWPNLFVPSDQCAPLPLIRRRWSLGATILSLCEDPIVLKSRTFECTSPQASIIGLQGASEINKPLLYNEQARTDMHFEAMRKDRDVRSFEAEANVLVAWHRASSPENLNYYAVPTVKLMLPNQEPRVLMQVDQETETGCVAIRYYIENATSHVLGFAVSMPSVAGFMVEGLRATTLRVLPFSRQSLEYTLYPTQDPLTSPLPELRVFDTTYKKVLAVNPDTAHVEGGKLKAFRLPA